MQTNPRMEGISGPPTSDKTDSIYNRAMPTGTVQFLSMDFLKTLGGKIVSGLMALGVIAAGVSWWQMDPATRQMLLTGTGRIASWLGIVLFVPWIGFFLIGRVGKLDSNAAGAALILGVTAVEAALLGWLFHWNVHGPTAITFFLAAMLLAGVYNLFACDWIAEQLE